MPSLDFTQVGVAFVAFLAFGSLAFWGWVTVNRTNRERREEFEPRQNPPLWRQYAFKEDVERQMKEMRDRMDKMQEESSESRRKLYEQIRELGSGVSALDAKTEMIHRNVDQLGTKIDRLSERFMSHE